MEKLKGKHGNYLVPLGFLKVNKIQLQQGVPGTETNSKSHWDWMVGRWTSFWDDLFSGALCCSFQAVWYSEGHFGNHLSTIFKFNHLKRSGCFLKWWYPQIIHFNRCSTIYYKPSILGYHHFRKHPSGFSSRASCEDICMWLPPIPYPNWNLLPKMFADFLLFQVVIGVGEVSWRFKASCHFVVTFRLKEKRKKLPTGNCPIQPLVTGNLFTLILHHQEPTSSTEQIAFSTAQLSWNSQTGIQDTHDACPVVKLCISASLRWVSHHPSLSLRFFGGAQRSQNMQVCCFFRRRYRTTNPNNALLLMGNPSKLPFLLFDSPKMGNLMTPVLSWNQSTWGAATTPKWLLNSQTQPPTSLCTLITLIVQNTVPKDCKKWPRLHQIYSSSHNHGSEKWVPPILVSFHLGWSSTSYVPVGFWLKQCTYRPLRYKNLLI